MRKGEGFSVDLRKEMFYLLRRWLLIAVSMIVFGALVGGLKYYIDKNQYNKQKNSPAEEIVLSDAEVEEVNHAAMYKKQIDELNEYLKSSVYINLDYHNVNTTKLTYIVELDTDEELAYEEELTQLGSICEMYNIYVGGDTILNDINAEELYGLENRYIDEMITIEEYSADEYVDKIMVYIINNEQIEGITEEIKASLEAYCSELNKDGMKHELRLIEEINYTAIDNKVLSASQALQSDIYTTNTRYQKAVEDLNDNQELLYNKIIAGEDVELSELFSAENKSVEKPGIDIVFIIAGMLVGLVIACGLLILKYSLSDKVLSDKDFEGLFELKYLGLLFDDKYAELRKKSVINRWEYGDLLESEYKEKLNFVALKLKLMCDKKGINKVALISSDYSNLSDEIVEDLCQRIKTEDIELVKVGNVLTDSKEMRKLFDAGACIFAEATNKTKIKKMNQLVELCYENNIEKLGVVEINA